MCSPHRKKQKSHVKMWVASSTAWKEKKKKQVWVGAIDTKWILHGN